MAPEQSNSLIKPADFSRTVENIMHVFKEGNHEKLPDLLQDAGNLLMKASKRLTPTQLVLAVAGVAVAAIFVVSRIDEDVDFHRDAA